jgi:hypothetical protein
MVIYEFIEAVTFTPFPLSGKSKTAKVRTIVRIGSAPDWLRVMSTQTPSKATGWSSASAQGSDKQHLSAT